MTNLYNLNTMLVAISGLASLRRIQVMPVVVSGGPTGTGPKPKSLDISKATADGHEAKVGACGCN